MTTPLDGYIASSLKVSSKKNTPTLFPPLGMAKQPNNFMGHLTWIDDECAGYKCCNEEITLSVGDTDQCKICKKRYTLKQEITAIEVDITETYLSKTP